MTREEEDADDEIIMALDRRGPRVGCAYFIVATSTLGFFEDLEYPPSDIVSTLRLQISPTTILAPSRFEDALPRREDGEEEVDGLRITVRPAGDFSYDAARQMMMRLKLGEENGPTLALHVPGELSDTDTTQGALLRLAAWIDIESRVTVGCVGAVLNWVQKRRAIESHDGRTPTGIEVDKLEMVSLKDTMFINGDTMRALQIFENESHPNFHMQGKGGRGKEGLSLFGIMNLTRSTLGQRMLKQWFLRPTLNIEIILERNDGISMLLKPENSPATDAIQKFLRKVKNIPKIIGQLKRGKGSAQRGGEWNSLMDFCVSVLKVRTAMQEMVGVRELPIYQKIMKTFDVGALQLIAEAISGTIDFPESAIYDRVVVQQGIDKQLDELKHVHDGIVHMLVEVGRAISADLDLAPDISSRLNVVFFPQLGYMITMPNISEEGSTTESESRSTRHTEAPVGMSSLYEGPDWTMQFFTQNAFYYKHPKTRALDEEIGDVFGQMIDREIEVCHALQTRVLEHERMLVDCTTIISELDCLSALTEAAVKYKFNRPLITEKNVINIVKGRHPLQELCVPAFVENDTHLLGGPGPDPPPEEPGIPPLEGPSMMLLTGPNYSGKSVYLKQVALIVYLAHIGSFVPATEAVIGLTDCLLTRLQTRESVTRIQSAFLIDLEQISLSLRLATHRSLVIIDEFGKGTDSADGAGLACATFEALLARGSARPKVLAATHFHEILEPPLSFLPPQEGLAFFNMRITLDRRARAEDMVTYLYTLHRGRSDASFGTVCAALNGIDEEVVARAEELIALMNRGEDLVAACARLGEGERRELAMAEEAVRRFVAGRWGECEDMEEDGEGAGSVREKLRDVLRGI
ncbi:muts domain V-domain-containing protein [Geopyxis carbonaria]|nr:muts domain V-domain-containing protein [Geopyxis carbonaria]